MAQNPRLSELKQEFIGLRDGCKYLDALAGIEKRDLTDAEKASYEVACTRMEAIEADITTTLARQAKFDKVADVNVVAGVVDTVPAAEVHTRIEHVAPRSPVTYDPQLAGTAFDSRRSSEIVTKTGEYLLRMGRAAFGMAPLEGQDAVEPEILKRVVAHGVAADGTAPVTIEGDLVKFVDANRYAVNAARQLPMPDNHAPTFKRPRVMQRTTVGQQVTEGDVLSSQRLQLTGDTVTKGTYGGVLSLSEQEIDWTEPAMLGLAIQDLAESYAIATDTVLTAAIEAQADQASAVVLSLTAASDVLFKAVADAAAVVYAASKKLPDTFFVAVDRWAYLAALTDGDGRPLFPNAGPMNVPGSGSGVASFTGWSILGQKVVVDPNFNTNIWALASSQLVEFYEQNKGLLSINVPSTLEIQYAYRGYAAANVYAQGVCGFETS